MASFQDLLYQFVCACYSYSVSFTWRNFSHLIFSLIKTRLNLQRSHWERAVIGQWHLRKNEIGTFQGLAAELYVYIEPLVSKVWSDKNIKNKNVFPTTFPRKCVLTSSKTSSAVCTVSGRVSSNMSINSDKSAGQVSARAVGLTPPSRTVGLTAPSEESKGVVGHCLLILAEL